jgi:uncharacterized membrane protein
MALFVGAAVALGILRLQELYPGAYDLGIFQQALWSGGHGGPFFEAPDFEKAGFGSLFQVHISIWLFPLAGAYVLAPSAATLFVAQALALALAALPLYLLARDVPGGSPRAGLFVALVYLGWAPLLAGALFDFHLEAFVPATCFLVAWLAETRRYRAALLASVLAVGSFEFAGILMAGLGAFYLLRTPPAVSDPDAAPGRRARAWLGDPSIRFGIALVALGGTAYLLLEWAKAVLVPSLLHLSGPPGPSAGSLTGLSAGFPLAPQYLTIALGTKIGMWALAYALVGGLPLWAPRTQIAAAPWALFSFLSPAAVFVLPGYQYAFLLAVPVFLGSAFGAPAAARRARRWFGREGAAPRAAPTRRSFRLARDRRSLPAAVFGALLLANLLVGPLDPALQTSPALGYGYAVGYAPATGYSSVQALRTLVPAGASVVATARLFPLVSNDVNAYALEAPNGPPTGFLPFGPAHLPSYVLVGSDELADVPGWLAAALYGSGAYRAAGLAGSTPDGPVLLFGPAGPGPFRAFGSPPPAQQSFGAGALYPGSAGTFVGATAAGDPAHIASRPGERGTVFYGPYASLLGGRYAVSARLNVSEVPPNGPPGAPLLSLTVIAFGQAAWAEADYGPSELALGAEANYTLVVTVPGPSIGVELVGIVLAPQASVLLESVTISALASPPAG